MTAYHSILFMQTYTFSWQGEALPADWSSSDESVATWLAGMEITMSLTSPEAVRLDKTSAWFGLNSQVCSHDDVLCSRYARSICNFVHRWSLLSLIPHVYMRDVSFGGG